MPLVIIFFHFPGWATVNKTEVRVKLAHMYGTNPDVVFVFSCQTKLGGGQTTSFAAIYDTLEDAKRHEPKHRLRKQGLIEFHKRRPKQHRSHFKNYAKRFRGKKRGYYRQKCI